MVLLCINFWVFLDFLLLCIPHILKRRWLTGCNWNHCDLVFIFVSSQRKHTLWVVSPLAFRRSYSSLEESGIFVVFFAFISLLLISQDLTLSCDFVLWPCHRLFRKFVFGAADEIELKFVNRYIQMLPWILVFWKLYFVESDVSAYFSHYDFFVSAVRRSREDLNLLSLILNQEIRRLATQVRAQYFLGLRKLFSSLKQGVSLPWRLHLHCMHFV